VSVIVASMHRSSDGHNHYKFFSLPIDYSKNFITRSLQTIEHLAVFVVKSIHIQINGHVMALSTVALMHSSTNIQSPPNFCNILLFV